MRDCEGSRPARAPSRTCAARRVTLVATATTTGRRDGINAETSAGPRGAPWRLLRQRRRREASTTSRPRMPCVPVAPRSRRGFTSVAYSSRTSPPSSTTITPISTTRSLPRANRPVVSTSTTANSSVRPSVDDAPCRPIDPPSTRRSFIRHAPPGQAALDQRRSSRSIDFWPRWEEPLSTIQKTRRAEA